MSLIARGAHLAALRERGLELRSTRGDVHVQVRATDDPAEVGPVDLVLLCVKSYDTREAAARLAPLLADGGAVISLQNGVDNEDVLAEVVGADRVLGGVAFIFSTIAGPGVVAHTGGPGSIVFGELDGTTSARCERLLALCQAADVPAELVGDVRVRLWDKLAFICAHAGMTATTRVPIGVVRQTPATWAMFRGLAAEVAAVAEAEGAPLPPDPVGRLSAFAQGMEAGNRSSLLYDLEHGKRLEVDALHGAVVRRAVAHGIPVPLCEAVYAILEPWLHGPPAA